MKSGNHPKPSSGILRNVAMVPPAPARPKSVRVLESELELDSADNEEGNNDGSDTKEAERNSNQDA